MIFEGKGIVIAQLERLTNRKVSMGFFEVTLPFNLEIKNLNIDGLLTAESITISPSLPYFMMGNFAFNNVSIVRPLITLEKIPPPVAELPVAEPVAAPATETGVKTAATPGAKEVAKSAPAAPEKKRPLRLIFKRFTVKDGRIDFIDYTVRADGIRITVKDINFNLTNLYTFPFSSVIANFELKGRIPWQEGTEEGKISLEGWLNFYKKDMQASIKIEDIDGIYLSPYYSHWIDLEKARIEKANLNFTSNIQGLNNNITADCHLELTDIVRSPRPPEEPQEKAEKITNIVIDTLRALDQGKIVLDFTIKTKMDRPEFGLGNIKMAFEDRIAKVFGPSTSGIKPADILLLPLKIIEGSVKGATDISKAVIDGTFAVGNEFKKAVEDSFKTESKDTR